MPRQARIDVVGALRHIVIRGIERRKIFKDDKDRVDFIDRLAKLLSERTTPCYAWALMKESALEMSLIGQPNHLEAIAANFEKRSPTFSDPE